MSLLAEIFTSKSRASVMEKMFNGQGDKYYLRQLEKETGLGLPTIRKEVIRLSGLDLIKEEKNGNRIYYWANEKHPLYSVLRELVDRTSGARFKLEEAFKDNPKIDMAFIFGSYVKGNTHAESDIDLFVVGSIKAIDLSEIISEIEEEIGYTEINYHNYTNKSLIKSIKEKKHFIMSLKETEKIFVKGSTDGFKKLFKQVQD